jgi:hypothetical protein
MRSPCIGEREEPPPPPKEEREELQRCGHGLGIEEARGERHRMTRLAYRKYDYYIRYEFKFQPNQKTKHLTSLDYQRN